MCNKWIARVTKRALKTIQWAITRRWKYFDKIMLSECKGDFKHADIPHKMDEILQTAGLPADIDVISDSTSDSEVPPTPHPPYVPYKNACFTTILGSVSFIT
jgi:hypothetical protein